MMLILPVLFSVAYWAFWGFVLGDWSWHLHAMDWPGEGGYLARLFHALVFALGVFASFIAGVCAHD